MDEDDSYLYKWLGKPLVKYSDIPEPTLTRIVDIVSLQCEVYEGNYEMSAQMIFDKLHEHFGHHWIVVVGNGFGFSITYETNYLLYQFFDGTVAALVYKINN